jgi:hypothetical protein
MKPAVLAVPAALLLAGCASSSASTPAAAVSGRVLSAPSCPVAQQGVPCPPRPVAGAAVVASRSGVVIARAHTDDHGYFHLTVASGRCRITATNLGGYQSTASRVVLVGADRTPFVRLVVDSGIR